MSWVSLSIIAALLWALVNVVDKFVLSKWSVHPIVPTFFACLVGFVGSVFIFVFLGFERLTPLQTVLALGGGGLYVALILLYLYAVRLSEVSRVAPLFYLSPVFIAVLAAFFLGEVFAPVKYLGVLLLVGGAILISLRDISSFHSDRAFYFMCVSAFLLAVSEVLVKYLLNFTDFWHVFAYLRLGAFIAIIPVSLIYLSDIRALWMSEKATKKTSVIAVTEVISMFGVLLLTLAASTGYITLVNALAAVQPFFLLLFTVLLSLFVPHILEEVVNRNTVLLKLIAIICMFAGALLVS